MSDYEDGFKAGLEAAMTKRKRGYILADVGAANLEKVRAWVAAHPGGTNRECSAALELSEHAVGRHIKTLRSEWQRAGK